MRPNFSSHDDDGRDPLVAKYYGPRTIRTEVSNRDHEVDGYIDPWLPCYYSRRDDQAPGRISHLNYFGVIGYGMRVEILGFIRYTFDNKMNVCLSLSPEAK